MEEEKKERLKKAQERKLKTSTKSKPVLKEKNLKRKENEKTESTKGKRKTQEMSLQKPDKRKSSAEQETSGDITNKRKKEIKDEEKKQCLAKEKAAQKHAAKLFSKMHAHENVSESPIPIYETPSALPETLPNNQTPKVSIPTDQIPKTLPKDQTSEVVPKDNTPPAPQTLPALAKEQNPKSAISKVQKQTAIPEDQTQKVFIPIYKIPEFVPKDHTPPTIPTPTSLPKEKALQPNIPKDQNPPAILEGQTPLATPKDHTPSTIPKDQTLLTHSSDQNPVILPKENLFLAIPKDQTPEALSKDQTQCHSSFAHVSNNRNNLEGFPRQPHGFNPSAFPAGHIKYPFYSQISPFQNAQPLPPPNFSYNFQYKYVPNAPGYPSSDFPSQASPNPHLSNPYWFNSNCNFTSPSNNHTNNTENYVRSNVSATSQFPSSKTHSTQSNYTSPYNSNLNANPNSPPCTSPDDSTNFSPSEFMSSSMALLDDTSNISNIDIETVSDIDIDLEDNPTETLNIEIETNSPSANKEIKNNPDNTNIQSTKKIKCPDCLKKDKEIADLKMRLYKSGASSSQGEVVSKNRSYKPKTRPDIKMGDYVVVPEKTAPPAGFQILAPGATIAVKPLWIEDVLATVGKGREKRNRKALKKGTKVKTSYSGEIIKKLMDGFFDPEELAVGGGTTAFNGNAIYESLKLYAIHCLAMDTPSFNECWREKMSSSKQTIKRLHKTLKNSLTVP